MATIKSIGVRARKNSDIKKSGASAWSIEEIVSNDARSWLASLVRGRAFESRALSMWRLHPNLQMATEKLAEYLTPKWPAPDGSSALAQAIENAVTRVDIAIQRGEVYHGRLVGIYLHWLVNCVRDVERIEVHGYTRHGERLVYQHFSEPLRSWVTVNEIEHLEALSTETPASDEVIAGLRTHLIASITEPIDAGYLALNTPQGFGQ
ncbi:MAG: hypothetical protein QE279_01425 [Rhodoferax sp.]|nr:hypothetical protein [Rhodoferax sp.]